MKKKSIFAMLFCLIISVCVLFTGCGETELSGINAKIETMQQQITDLQNRLNEAEENQQDLLLDLTTAKGQLLTLQEQVNGKENNYLKLNDKFSYSFGGIKLFDLTLTEAIYNSTLKSYRTEYIFKSYVTGIENLYEESLNISALFYDCTTDKTYVGEIREDTNLIVFSSISNEPINGYIYIYVGNTFSTVYNISSVSL